MSPLGGILITRGPDAWNYKNFSSEGVGWISASAMGVGYTYFYTGDISKFSMKTFEGWGNNLSVSGDAGFAVGVNVSWVQNPNAPGEYLIGVGGGAGEMAIAGGIAYFTAGLATPVSGVMMFDGTARVVANTQRLYLYFNHNTALANAFPTSLGGLAGKGIDMLLGTSATKIGYGQAVGSWGNDLASFAVMGGTGNALWDLIKYPSPYTMSNYLFTVGSYPYSLYNDKPDN